MFETKLMALNIKQLVLIGVGVALIIITYQNRYLIAGKLKNK
jgi:hypothetical protein